MSIKTQRAVEFTFNKRKLVSGNQTDVTDYEPCQESTITVIYTKEGATTTRCTGVFEGYDGVFLTDLSSEHEMFFVDEDGNTIYAPDGEPATFRGDWNVPECEELSYHQYAEGFWDFAVIYDELDDAPECLVVGETDYATLYEDGSVSVFPDITTLPKDLYTTFNEIQYDGHGEWVIGEDDDVAIHYNIPRSIEGLVKGERKKTGWMMNIQNGKLWRSEQPS